jgi:nucleoside-diphosphate-sugar epimerase
MPQGTSFERARPAPAADRRTVLVTGGAGFIGSHLVDALVDRGVRVRVLDNFATGRRENLNPAAQLFAADIRSFEAIEAAFAGVDCVFHTAALARVPLSIEQPLETHLANVVGTLNVLLAAERHQVRRVINSGSSSVYGDQPSLPLVETMAPRPINPYALQKLTAEEYVRMFHRFRGREGLTLRYFNVYGPRMTVEGAYLTVISLFLKARRAGQPLVIFGDGEQTRDFTHVSDVVRANLLAMDCDSGQGLALNIGRGNAVSVNTIARMIGGATVHQAPRPGDARDTLADLSRARDLLGWAPEVTIEAGLTDLLAANGQA